MSRDMQILECGTFRGDAEIETADISGCFEGNLTVTDRLLIRSTGFVSGVVRYSSVEIEAGGQIAGDIQVTVESINFGNIPVGATVDTTFTVGNTGGGAVNVTLVEEYGDNYTVLDPGPFSISPGGTYDVGVRFHHATAGYDATFIKIISDDIDEGGITFPVLADDSPLLMALGEQAADFSHQDTGGVTHTLSGYRGRVVVMAFFANW